MAAEKSCGLMEQFVVRDKLGLQAGLPAIRARGDR